jgi:hypothetical protein
VPRMTIVKGLLVSGSGPESVYSNF